MGAREGSRRSWGMVRGIRRTFLLCLLCCLPAWAQNFRGSIFGTVEDSGGKRVTGAKVEVHPVESPALRREATTDSSGEFRIDDLLPGAYTLTVRAAGFAEAQAEVS